MNRNFTIDLFRLIAALCIMSIHAPIPGFGYGIGTIVHLSGRWAVPFFFIASGYFFGKKLTVENKLYLKDIEKNVLNLISIFIIASVVYSVHSTLFAKRWFTNDVGFLLNGTYWHLWFIGSMIFGYLTLWYCFNINIERFLPVISMIIIAIALLSDSYDVLLHKAINYEQIPRFLTSIPFMYVGVYVSRRKINKKALPVWIVVFLAGFVLQFVEALFLYEVFQNSPKEHQILVGSVISSVALFVICLSLNTTENLIARLGKKYSLFIYLYHLIVYWFIRKACWELGVLGSGMVMMLIPVVGFFIILGGAVILNRFFPGVFSVLNGNLRISVGNKKYKMLGR